MSYRANYVFGYGSLVDKERLAVFLKRNKLDSSFMEYCSLQGYRRIWNVAMDNSIDLPNYKYYVDSITGERPDVYVTFLNIKNSPNDIIEGILFKVSHADLEHLDQRERNYQRIDVSDKIVGPVSGIAWTYIGLTASEKNFLRGLRKGNAIISREYYQIVYNGYYTRGQKALLNYLNTTDKANIPLRNLKLRKVE